MSRVPQDMIDAWAADDLNEADRAALDRWLAEDPDHGVEFLRSMMLHRHLGDLAPVAARAQGRPAERASIDERQPFKLRTHLYLLAAGLMLAAAAVAIYFAVSSLPHSPIPDPTSPPPVATLIESTGSPVFYENDIARDGGEYARGMYSIDSGSAQFLLRSRVTVDLRGKTQLRMYNPSSVYLARGEAAFKVPTGAEGFTVHLPDGSRVIDLGTEFNVALDGNGRSQVVVTKGSVRVIHASTGDDVVFIAGQGAVLDENGFQNTTERRVRIDGTIAGDTSANNSIVATFTSDDLFVGDSVVIDLNVEPVDAAQKQQWFGVFVNPAGPKGLTKAQFGGVLRTDRVSQGNNYDQHAIVVDRSIDFIGVYTDQGIGNGGGRIRMRITLSNGFDALADYELQIDDDGDGEFEHARTGRFMLGPQMAIGIATDFGAHRYTTHDAIGNEKQKNEGTLP